MLRLEADPTEHITAVRAIAGVIARGRWRSRVELDAMLGPLR